MSVAALGFTACDDYEEVAPQSNPQGEQVVMSVDGLTVARPDALAGENPAVNLGTIEEDSVELIVTTATPELNPGDYVTYDAEIAIDNTFAQVQRVTLNNGKIFKEDLDAAFRALFGKTPNAREMYFRFIPYMATNTSRVLFKQDTYLMSDLKVNVTPINLNIEVDAQGYYIITDTYFAPGWEESLVKLDNGGGDVYDDAVFTALADLSSEIFFIGASDVDAAVAGDPYDYVWSPVVEEGADVGLTGRLTYGVDAMNVRTIPIANATKYEVSIDMLERTYEVKEFVPTLYMVSPSLDADFEMVPANNNTGETGKWWSIAYVGTDGISFKEWNGEAVGAIDGTASMVDGVTLTANGGTVATNTAGWYLVGVEKTGSADAFSYSVTLFPANVYVYGDCNGGGWGDDPAWMFTVPTTADGEFVSPALAADGELRLCVHPLNADGSDWIGEWWTSEFIFFDGKIAYRGRGGDQERVNVTAGQVVYLNFATGDARVE